MSDTSSSLPSKSLSQLVVNGNPTALSLVKTFIDSPVLINLGILKTGRMQGAPFAIPLETQSHRQIGAAEVSESLVITSDGKKTLLIILLLVHGCGI